MGQIKRSPMPSLSVWVCMRVCNCEAPGLIKRLSKRRQCSLTKINY